MVGRREGQTRVERTDVVQARRALSDKLSGMCFLVIGNRGSSGRVQDGTEKEAPR